MRKILNTNNLFLLAFALLLWFGISMFWQSYSRQSDLVFHKGILADKRISVAYYTRRIGSSSGRLDSTLTFHFTIAGSPSDYTVSWLPKAMNNLLEKGDTVVFYTKPIVSTFGNGVSNGLGRFTTTHSDREVYHLVCNRYMSPLLDFNQYNKSMRTGGWFCLAMSVVCIFCYFLKRYGNGFG